MKSSMPDRALFARPALSFSCVGSDDTYRLEAMLEGHVLHILAAPNAPEVEQRLRAIADGGAQSVRWFGPGQWLVVGDSVLSPDDVRSKAAVLGEGLALSDQSHGHVRLAVFGPQSRKALARGCGVDFSEEEFPLSGAAATLFNHIGIHATRMGEDRFELIVLRSFARSLWEQLQPNL
jgi:sarcosine oxidase subunit gamma